MSIVVDAGPPTAEAVDAAAMCVMEEGNWAPADWALYLDEVADTLQADRRYLYRCDRDAMKRTMAACLEGGGAFDLDTVRSALEQGMIHYLAQEREHHEMHEEKHRPSTDSKALNEAFAGLPIPQQQALRATGVVVERDRAIVLGELYDAGTSTIHVPTERFILHPALQQVFGCVAFTWRAPRLVWDNAIRAFFHRFCTDAAVGQTERDVMFTGRKVLDWMLAHSAFATLALDTTHLIQGYEFATREPIGSMFSRSKRRDFILYAEKILDLMETLTHTPSAAKLRAVIKLAQESRNDHLEARDERAHFTGAPDSAFASQLQLLEDSDGDITLLLGRVALVPVASEQPTFDALRGLLSGHVD